MRDATAHDYERTRRATEDIRAYLADAGYVVIDTPLLEETELFVRKSGGELTSRLYTFTDPGGHKVSLRPEFTSSVIRHFIEERSSGATPVRWQYCGPVFRYEQGDNGGYHQFTQLGAELVGEAGVDADAEIICLALGGLGKIGLRGCRLRVGHLGVLLDLLGTYRLSEPAKLFIVSNVQALKDGSTDVAALKERAEEVGVLRAGLHPNTAAVLEAAGTEADQKLVQRLLQESMPTPMGRRTTEQIVARLLRKVSDADDPGTFEDALGLASRLAHLEGPPETVLEEARRVTSERGLPSDAFDELERLFDELTRCGTPEGQVTLDLGFARGISYYTGVIFELYASSDEGVSLGGGGRYDGLVRALGGDDVPALGFAYNLDRVLDTLAGASS